MLRETRKRINGQYIWLYEGVSKVTKLPSSGRKSAESRSGRYAVWLNINSLCAHLPPPPTGTPLPEGGECGYN